MLIAAEWLYENEGDDDEQLPMRSVADWLRHTADKQVERDTFKQVAKEHGVSVRSLRTFLKGKQ